MAGSLTGMATPSSNVLDLFRLDGRTALVTGAASGLGAAIAVALAQAGATVAAHGNRRAADETAAAIVGGGGNARAFRADLSLPTGPDDLMEQVTHALGPIDLDLRRFDLRRIDGENLPDLRCIYPASFDLRAKKWLDATVVVRGQVETYHGAARLLQVQGVRAMEG